MKLAQTMVVIEAYQKLIAQLPELILRKGKTPEQVYKAMGWNDETWDQRMRTGNFTPAELRKVLEVLEQ
jgi:hypothetical protein